MASIHTHVIYNGLDVGIVSLPISAHGGNGDYNGDDGTHGNSDNNVVHFVRPL